MRECTKCNQALPVNARFCFGCGEAQPDEIICLKCNYPNEGNSKFCQECGLNLLEDTSQPPRPRSATTPIAPVSILADLPEPGSGITIEFPYSTASSFDFAVDAARKIPSFQQFGENKKAIYRVNTSVSEVETLLSLTEHLRGWRKRQVYLDGVKTTWDSVFSFAGCYEQKHASFKPQFYCLGYENDYQLNLWGCTQAWMPWKENSEFWTWGKWLNAQGDWQWDKQRIRHELEKKLYNVRFCPAINTDQLEAVLSALPEKVNPFADRGWTYVQSYYDDARPKLRFKIQEDGWEQEIAIVGVCPKGTIAIAEIARKIGVQLPSF